MTEYFNYEFEDGLEPAGMVVSGSGTINFDSTTPPAPLAGTFSMNMAATSSATPLDATTALGVSTPTLCTYMLFNAAVLPATSGNTAIITFFDTIGGQCCGLTLSGSTNRFTLTATGGTSANGPANLIGGTTYHIWVEFTKSGAGLADALTKLYYSTDGIKPASPTVQVVNGTVENDVETFMMSARNRGYLPEYRDNIRGGNIAYGDNGTLPSTEQPGWIGPIGLSGPDQVLLANAVVDIIVTPNNGAAAVLMEQITLSASGVPTVDNSLIGVVGTTCNINIRTSNTSDVTYRDQLIVDLNV